MRHRQLSGKSHLALALACAASVLFSAQDSAPAAGKPKASKSTAPADPPPAPAPKLSKFDAPVEPAPGPAAGPVGLKDLIDLALFNDPVVNRIRGELEVAHAKRKAATDWEDPEMRFSWGTLLDVDVGSPYNERELNYGSYSESRTNVDGTSGYGEFQIDTERTRTRESRYQTIERRVTPGATRDKIEETIYEARRTNSRGSRKRHEYSPSDGDVRRTDAHYERDSRRIVGKEFTYVEHPDSTSPEDQFGVMLRIPFPHPWEMAGKVAAAEAEIKQADWELKEAEAEVVLKVRELYDKLCFYQAEKGVSERLQKLKEKSAEVSRLTQPEKLAAAVKDSSQAALASFDRDRRATAARLELAYMAGLRDPNRISVGGLRRREVGLMGLELDWLIQMASIYRADLGRVRAKHEIARAEYRELSARKIPFSTYLDIGWERNLDREGRDADEFYLRLGVSLPLWSWLFNDEEKVHEAEARAFSRQIGRLNDSIAAQVISAVEGLRMADQALGNYRKHRAAIEMLAKDSARGATDIEKGVEISSQLDELNARLDVDELDIIRFYNERVLELERALGAPLELVLGSRK